MNEDSSFMAIVLLIQSTYSIHTFLAYWLCATTKKNYFRISIKFWCCLILVLLDLFDFFMFSRIHLHLNLIYNAFMSKYVGVICVKSKVSIVQIYQLILSLDSCFVLMLVYNFLFSEMTLVFVNTFFDILSTWSNINLANLTPVHVNLLL